MVKSNNSENREVRLLQDLLIATLASNNLRTADIQRIVGVDINRVVSITKGFNAVKKEKKD